MESALQVVVVTVLLTVLGGVGQVLPWGLGSARQITQRATEGDGSLPSGDAVLDVSSSPIVTADFERIAVGHVSTLTTDRSFSWIVSKPLDYYRPNRYLAREVITQFVVATGMVMVHTLLGDASPGTTILVVAVAALMTAIATHGQLANWWGLPVRYAAGVSLVLIASWVLSITAVTLIWR